MVELTHAKLAILLTPTHYINRTCCEGYTYLAKVHISDLGSPSHAKKGDGHGCRGT